MNTFCKSRGIRTNSRKSNQLRKKCIIAYVLRNVTYQVQLYSSPTNYNTYMIATFTLTFGLLPGIGR